MVCVEEFLNCGAFLKTKMVSPCASRGDTCESIHTSWFAKRDRTSSAAKASKNKALKVLILILKNAKEQGYSLLCLQASWRRHGSLLNESKCALCMLELIRPCCANVQAVRIDFPEGKYRLPIFHTQ